VAHPTGTVVVGVEKGRGARVSHTSPGPGPQAQHELQAGCSLEEPGGGGEEHPARVCHDAERVHWWVAVFTASSPSRSSQFGFGDV